MCSYYKIKEIKLHEIKNYHSCILISYSKKNSKPLSYEFFRLLKKYLAYTDFVKIDTDCFKVPNLINEGFTFIIKDRITLTFPTLKPDWVLFDKSLDNFVNKIDDDLEKSGCCGRIMASLFIMMNFQGEK